MNAIEAARLLGMKRARLEMLHQLRYIASVQREKLSKTRAEPPRIRAADAQLMHYNNEITKLNDEIFAMEQKLGIKRD